MIRRLFSVLLVASLGPLAACSGEGATSAETAATSDEDDLKSGKTRYVDIESTFKTEAEHEAWRTLRQKLVHEFDNICGDTYCGGDYSDLTAVQLACSATEKSGKVRECLWTFGGSYGAVNGPTGAIQTVATTFPCKFQVGASSKDFLALGATANPLQAPLPGRTQSIYDALSGCFQSKTILPLPTEGAFLDVNDGASEEDRTRYFELRDKLRLGFDQVCGDTFCEGDYSDIYGLSLRCSVDPKTGKLGACSWPFAGASSSVAASTGNVTSRRETWSCAIPVKGTLDGLLDSLGKAADPLHAPLPGTDKSIYDALADCLLGRAGLRDAPPEPRHPVRRSRRGGRRAAARHALLRRDGARRACASGGAPAGPTRPRGAPDPRALRALPHGLAGGAANVPGALRTPAFADASRPRADRSGSARRLAPLHGEGA